MGLRTERGILLASAEMPLAKPAHRIKVIDCRLPFTRHFFCNVLWGRWEVGSKRFCGLARKTFWERARCYSSTLCGKKIVACLSRMAITLCGPPPRPGTVNSLSERRALASAFIHALRKLQQWPPLMPDFQKN